MIRQWDIVSEIEKSAQDRLQFLGLPKFHPAEAYRVAIGRTVDRLSRYPEIAAIYQIGGISTPGISDIDLVVVFRDGRQSGCSIASWIATCSCTGFSGCRSACSGRDLCSFP
jgi:hypothetical protein